MSALDRRALLKGGLAAAVLAAPLLPRSESGLILPKSAEAQGVIPLDPVIITAPAPPDYMPFTPDFTVNFANQNAWGALAAYNSYVHWYLPQRQAYLASQYARVIPGDRPPLANPWQYEVETRIANSGLYIAEAMAVAFFLEGASSTIAEALPALRMTGTQLIAEGLAAGTIATRVALLYAGVSVGFAALGVLAASFSVIWIAAYYVVPEIQRQIRATSYSADNYSPGLWIAPPEE